MTYSPATAIEKGWIKNLNPKFNPKTDWEAFIQPNAIDFTLDKLWEVDKTTIFIITSKRKVMRERKECELYQVDGLECFSLKGETLYDGMSDFYLDLPNEVSAKIIPRSTMARNGVYVFSGFEENQIKISIPNSFGNFVIQKGTTIGQIMFYSNN